MKIDPIDYRGYGATYANATVHSMQEPGMIELRVVVRFHKDVFLVSSLTNPVVSNLSNVAKNVAGKAIIPFHPNHKEGPGELKPAQPVTWFDPSLSASEIDAMKEQTKIEMFEHITPAVLNDVFGVTDKGGAPC